MSRPTSPTQSTEVPEKRCIHGLPMTPERATGEYPGYCGCGITEVPGDPTCICQGTGLTTRLTQTGNTGPEICECVARKARQSEHQRLKEALEKIEAEVDAELPQAGYYERVANIFDRFKAVALDTLDPSGEGIEIEDRELEPWEQDEARGIVERLIEKLRQAAGPRSREPLNVLVAAENLHLAADLLAAQLRQSDPSGEQGEESDWPAVTLIRPKDRLVEPFSPSADFDASDPGWETRRYVPATDPSKEEELLRRADEAEARAPRCSCGGAPDHPKQSKDCHVIASSKEVGGDGE